MKKTVTKRIEPENLEDQIIEFLAKGDLQQANTIKAFAELQGIEWPWGSLIEKAKNRASSSRPSDVLIPEPEPLPPTMKPQKAASKRPAKKKKKAKAKKKAPTSPRLGFSAQGHFKVDWPDWNYPAVMFLRHIEWFLEHVDDIRHFVNINHASLQEAQTQETYKYRTSAMPEPVDAPRAKTKRGPTAEAKAFIEKRL